MLTSTLQNIARGLSGFGDIISWDPYHYNFVGSLSLNQYNITKLRYFLKYTIGLLLDTIIVLCWGFFYTSFTTYRKHAFCKIQITAMKIWTLFMKRSKYPSLSQFHITSFSRSNSDTHYNAAQPRYYIQHEMVQVGDWTSFLTNYNQRHSVIQPKGFCNGYTGETDRDISKLLYGAIPILLTTHCKSYITQTSLPLLLHFVGNRIIVSHVILVHHRCTRHLTYTTLYQNTLQVDGSHVDSALIADVISQPNRQPTLANPTCPVRGRSTYWPASPTQPPLISLPADAHFVWRCH